MTTDTSHNSSETYELSHDMWDVFSIFSTTIPLSIEVAEPISHIHLNRRTLSDNIFVPRE